MQIRMQGDPPTAAFLGDAIINLDRGTDLAVRSKNHLPGQFGDLARPQAGLDGKQDNDAVAFRIASLCGKGQKAMYLFVVQNTCLFASHLNHQIND